VRANQKRLAGRPSTGDGRLAAKISGALPYSLTPSQARAVAENQLRTEPCELSDVEDAQGAERERLSAERDSLLAHLGQLDEEDRHLLIMRYFEELSWDAVADVLECSVDKARSDFVLALERLSRKLGA